MTWIGELWRRLRFRLLGSRFEQDLAEEMRLHMDLRAAEKQAGGMSSVAALWGRNEPARKASLFGGPAIG